VNRWNVPQTTIPPRDSQNVSLRVDSTYLYAAQENRTLSISFPLYAAALAIVLSLTTGCQSWGPAAQIKQCQLESDRLLAEFRAQKKRADELEGKLQDSQSRLADAEKLLARIQNGNGTTDRVLANRGANANRAIPSNSANVSDRNFSSGSLGVSSDAANNSDPDIQWRPKGAPLR
jgi:hypothetical protein